ncbi:hypothetical protein [Winslowiella arboricola]|nr:hypothetical protein [Winslowiella arboricola]
MAEIIKNVSERAYAVAQAVAFKYSKYNPDINDPHNVSTSAVSLARQRSAKRSAAELNLMFEKAFAEVIK